MLLATVTLLAPWLAGGAMETAATCRSPTGYLRWQRASPQSK
jgi:hypothetical protein